MVQQDIESTMETPTVLTVRGLEKRFFSKIAVNQLSFHIKKGEIYGLLGPNGAGKTTTIKAILGMVEFDQGDIDLLGENPAADPKAVKRNIGYVAEEPLLYESLTPAELFNFIASVRELDPIEAQQRVGNLMDSFDASRHYRDLIATLSKGNKQKIQIIAGLMHDPDLLILDEPLSGLDAKSRRIVRNIIELHTSAGKSVLLCTHAMEDAQDLCDRVGILNEGVLIAEGTVDELSQLSQSGTTNLEEIFLELTQQSESVAKATARLQDDYKREDE